LSLPAAQMAVLIAPGDFAEAASRLQSRYLELCGRPVTIEGRRVTPEKFEAWGSLWAHELLDIPFDDIIRTRAGMGSSQALAMSAILDLVRRPCFTLEIDPGDRTTTDQNWVILAASTILPPESNTVSFGITNLLSPACKIHPEKSIW